MSVEMTLLAFSAPEYGTLSIFEAHATSLFFPYPTRFQ